MTTLYRPVTIETARLDEDVTDAQDDVYEMTPHLLYGAAVGDGRDAVVMFGLMSARIDQLTERIEELEARA